MRAYSMDLRERALLDSDAGMKAADVATKYRVSGSWVRLLKQRRRETGEIAPLSALRLLERHTVMKSALAPGTRLGSWCEGPTRPLGRRLRRRASRRSAVESS